MIISDFQGRPIRSVRYGVLMRVVFTSLLTIVVLTSPLKGQPTPPDPAGGAATEKSEDKNTEAEPELTAAGRERLAIVCTFIWFVLIYTTVYTFLLSIIPKENAAERRWLWSKVLGGLVLMMFLAWLLTAPLETPADDPASASAIPASNGWFATVDAYFAPRESWFAGVTFPELTFLIVSTFGPLGGVLFTMFDDKLTLPSYDRRKREIKLGYLVDCAYGLGGALAVFLVIPTEVSIKTGLMKAIATAFVAGYAGRAIIAKAIGQLTARINEVAGTIENEDKALTLSREQLEGKTVDQNKLTQAIEESSPTGRTLIFAEVEQVLRKYSELSSERVLLAVPILEALVASDEEQDKLHRYHAALGLALLRGKEAFEAARISFDEAIRIRKKEKALPNGTYEFHRAVCRILPLLDKKGDELTEQNLTEIKRDLTEAAEDSYVKTLYDERKEREGTYANTVSVWLKNQSNLSAKDVNLE